MCGPKDERKLGRLGEKTLDFWASQVGITINKAQEDERGWDYLLEFPSQLRSQSDFHFPLDKDPSPIICFIQVKSTDGRERSCTVKLSNWVSLVKRPEPAFFLVFEFDHDQECQRAFLVHIGKEYIGKVLKRLREAGPEKRDELHEMMMDFSYGESELLPSFSGQGLRAAIMNHIGGTLENYVAWKQDLIKTAGYDDGGLQFDFLIAMPDEKRDIQALLVDFMLGLIPSLKVTKGTVWDVRFGIRADEPTDVLQDGIIELQRTPVGTGMILLGLDDGSKQIRLVAQVYTPQGLLVPIEEHNLKARFAAPFIDFVLWLSPLEKFEINYRFPGSEESNDLKDLRHVSQTVLLFHEAYCQGKAVEVELWFQSASIAKGRIVGFVPPSDIVVRMAQAISNAWEIVKSLDVADASRVNLADLLRQKERLEFLAFALGPNRPAVRIGFRSTDWSEAEVQTACIPMVVEVVLGQHHIAVAMAMFGQPKATGEINEDGRELVMDVTDIRICRKHIWESERPERYTHRELKEAVAREYEQDFAVILIDQ